MPVPNTFANATTSIPLSQLDNNFATAITIGNTAVQLGNTITTINNATLANVTISSVASPVSVAQGGTGSTTLTANNVVIGNGTGAVTFVAPGTSGNVLTSNGTAWTSASAVTAATQGGFRSAANAFYTGWGFGAGAGASFTTSRVYYQVFVVGQSVTWTKIGIFVTTAQAGTVARLGIYNWSGGIATTRLLDAGTVSLAATGTVEATISQTLSPGIYALAMIADSTTAQLRAASTSFTQFQYGIADGNNTTFCLYEAGSGSTLPATASATPSPQAATPIPIIFMRY